VPVADVVKIVGGQGDYSGSTAFLLADHTVKVTGGDGGALCLSGDAAAQAGEGMIVTLPDIQAVDMAMGNGFSVLALTSGGASGCHFSLHWRVVN
jgi:hypothetical protein